MMMRIDQAAPKPFLKETRHTCIRFRTMGSNNHIEGKKQNQREQDLGNMNLGRQTMELRIRGRTSPKARELRQAYSVAQDPRQMFK
ncbi:MAG TPA: hypothetical protein PLV78_05100, partial [Deltaproteobacteria bacterium]|nr:hypothetical protein [Deltaproteobacteria bacterium]